MVSITGVGTPLQTGARRRAASLRMLLDPGSRLDERIEHEGDTTVMLAVIAILIVMVRAGQWTGNVLVRRSRPGEPGSSVHAAAEIYGAARRQSLPNLAKAGASRGG